MVRTSVAFMGVGYTPVDRRSDRSIASYAVEAALGAIADAGLTRDDVDGLVGAPSAPNPSAVHADGADEIGSLSLIKHLGLRNLRWFDDVRGMSLGMSVAGSHALRAGDCHYVLGVRALYNLADRRYSEAGGGSAYGDEQFRLPFGYGPAGARFATQLRRYFAMSGATREDLFYVVKAAREYATLNPVAYWRDKGLSISEYVGARMICDPFGLFDCDMPVCGAGAVVLSTGDRAAAGPHPPAYIAGYTNMSETTSIFERSGRGRGDVQVCQLYDGYSIFIYQMLESLGLCDRGEAWRFVKEGHTRLGGALPVNTFGGSLGEGRLHGIGHLREGVLQVAGRAGDRQVSDVENCLVVVGTPDNAWQMMISRSEG